MKPVLFTTLLLIFTTGYSIFFHCNHEGTPDYTNKIAAGHFSEAEKEIRQVLSNDTLLSNAERRQLEFEIERMSRIKKDFNQTESDIFTYVRRYIPDVTLSDLQRWEKEKSLEHFLIDGEKRYFKYAGRNLFRLDAESKKIWLNFHKTSSVEKSFDLKAHVREVIQQSRNEGLNYVLPVRIRVNYRISVNKEEVPAGEIIRCWIPFPREIEGRQYQITLLSSDPADYQIAENQDCLQRTIYFEKPSEGDQETEFSVSYEFTSLGTYYPLTAATVKKLRNPDGLYPYLKEEPPHIVFTPELRALSAQIVGDEQNPYQIARKLYAWIDENIPWASAREYSTIRSLSQYCYENMHGDCGIKAMLFTTLLRMNGIPARWQSGWEFQPPHHNMHDWGMAYFEPYGWVPVDVDYGLQDSEEEHVKWFYLGGMDSYRLIFNDAYSQNMCPEKQHFRSETIDSQRGELEWEGGNLYFDQWSWNMQFQVLED